MLNQAQDPCKCNGEARVRLVHKVRMRGEPRVKQVAMEDTMDMVMAVVDSVLKAAKQLKEDSDFQAWEDSVLKVKPALKVRELK